MQFKENDIVYLKDEYYGQRLWNHSLMPVLYYSVVPMRVIRVDEETGDVLVDPQGPHQSFWMQRKWLRTSL